MGETTEALNKRQIADPLFHTMSVADGAQSAPSAPQCPAVPFLDASLTEGGRQRLQEAAQEFLTEV